MTSTAHGHQDQRDRLTDREREILRFERGVFRYAGSKEKQVRETFGLSLTQYHLQVNALLDRPAAIAEFPAVVRRLRGLRDPR